MHFSIAPEGYVQDLRKVILAAANPALQDCLANPLKELQATQAPNPSRLNSFSTQDYRLHLRHRLSQRR